MTTRIDIGERLADISHLEYLKLLGGEFIAHPDYLSNFETLKKYINTEVNFSGFVFVKAEVEGIELLGLL